MKLVVARTLARKSDYPLLRLIDGALDHLQLLRRELQRARRGNVFGFSFKKPARKSECGYVRSKWTWVAAVTSIHPLSKLNVAATNGRPYFADGDDFRFVVAPCFIDQKAAQQAASSSGLLISYSSSW